MGSLCAGVAHDVNNYLQVMVTELSTLGHIVRTRLPEAANVVAGLEALEYAANGASSVCRQILAFAKGSATGSGSDASQVLHAVSPMLKKLLPDRISLHLRVPDAPLWVVFDAKQLEQLLLNLLVNARHAVGEQGNVWIELSAHADSSAALLKVRDDGSGILPEVLPRIFDPYFSTKPPSEGAGLGLSVVYGVVTAAGGSIQVESQLGRGSCFELRLPLKASELPAALEVPTPGSGKPRLLLVDDFAPILRSMEKLFKSRGYEVVCASSAEGALSVLDAAGPAFDGLITDVRLPGISGVALVDELRRRGQAVPVILISGDTGHIHGAERFGPHFAVLSKPFKLADLFERFESLRAAALNRV
jgi:CheY-like chemotaxis protein